MRITDTFIIHIYNTLCTYSLICERTLIFTHAYFAHAYHSMIKLYAYAVSTLLCLLCAPNYRKPM